MVNFRKNSKLPVENMMLIRLLSTNSKAVKKDGVVKNILKLIYVHLKAYLFSVICLVSFHLKLIVTENETHL